MADETVGSGPVRFRVDGLRRTIRQLERAGADAQDMRDLMHEIGSIVADAAGPPVLTGTLQGTIRAGRGKTKAVVRAGGARARYAGVIHYGWPARDITPQPFLSDALTARASDVYQALDEGLKIITHRNELT